MRRVLTLLEADNVISLRTVYVQDDGDVACLRLMPAWLDSSVPTGRKRCDASWASQDYAYLYRHKRSPAEELELMQSPCMQQCVRSMSFEHPPEFKLVWTDSGHGVALYLNGEPWAFIDETTHRGYSKGILEPLAGSSSWNQELFEKTFND